MNINKYTPWQIFGFALAFVTIITLAIVWNDITTSWSHDQLEYMEENHADVMQWLRDNEGR